jgi:hypothetical protein
MHECTWVGGHCKEEETQNLKTGNLDQRNGRGLERLLVFLIPPPTLSLSLTVGDSPWVGVSSLLLTFLSSLSKEKNKILSIWGACYIS